MPTDDNGAGCDGGAAGGLAPGAERASDGSRSTRCR